VHPQADGVDRAPEGLGRFGVRELLPVHEQQRLAVGGLQLADRRQQSLPRRILGPFRGLGALFGRESAEQVVPATGAAIPLGDDPAGRPVKPEPVVRRRRNVGQPPPRDHENLGDDIGHVVRTGEAVDRVGLHRTEVRFVEAAEAAFPLILVTSHGRSSRVRSSCPVDLRLRHGTFTFRPSRLRFLYYRTNRGVCPSFAHAPAGRVKLWVCG
jgi:hypothetical protein